MGLGVSSLLPSSLKEGGGGGTSASTAAGGRRTRDRTQRAARRIGTPREELYGKPRTECGALVGRAVSMKGQMGAHLARRFVSLWPSGPESWAHAGGSHDGEPRLADGAAGA